MKAHYYAAHAAELRAGLARAIPRERLQALHRRRPLRHFLIAGRQFVVLGAATAAQFYATHPAVWVALGIVQGFTVFSFTVLLHEVVHHTVFARPRARLERLLGYCYAVPSGLAASQFTRWHLDHHAELGSASDDPKRHHLSPKVNARWYKLLYCTPALFPIYFRAARREVATYEAPLQRRIGLERRVALAVHLGVLGAIWWGAGAGTAFRAYVFPVFFVFPVAFTLNRLGQHYDIDPSDPAAWSTLVRGHWFWDLLFLNSNYHLEHHYFPGVPLYRLPALQAALTPFFVDRGMRWHTYGGLVRGWIVENRPPHTDWNDGVPTGAPSGAAGQPRAPMDLW
jgi:fatty acid desaturase